MIKVTPLGGDEFEVLVSNGAGESRHRVTTTPEVMERLASGRGSEAVIEAAFRFLLDREPKESILPRFELAVIGRYFPEFEVELRRYLARRRCLISDHHARKGGQAVLSVSL